MAIRANVRSDAAQILRPVVLSLLGLTVIGFGMAAKGWQQTSLLMGGMMAMVGLAMMLQVQRGVRGLRHESDAARRAARQAEEHYINVLQRVIRCAEMREQHAQGRSERIADLAERIGRQMGLSEHRCRLLHLAGRLHDIGLIAVPEHILGKSGALTSAERQLVTRHSEISYEVLRPLEMLREVLPAIRHHHERMNGTGYPNGLAGERIPLEARILAVADAYDALTHDRPFRHAVPPLEAMRELRRCSPAGFDPACVDALARIMHLESLEQAMAR